MLRCNPDGRVEITGFPHSSRSSGTEEISREDDLLPAADSPDLFDQYDLILHSCGASPLFMSRGETLPRLHPFCGKRIGSARTIADRRYPAKGAGLG